MAAKEITQKVIDFEFSRIQMKDEAQHHFFDEKPQTVRYTQWNLNNIIINLGLTEKNRYSVKWVGHDENSYLDAFIYCLFQGCRNMEDSQNNTFIKLKFHIYQLASRFLRVSDQRKMVQTLCSAQYAKNLPLYLNRNRVIYNIFDQLLKGFLDQSNYEYQQQMEDLKAFSRVFSFIKFQLINQFIGVLEHIGQKFYIINQKGCYFIIEEETQKQNALNLRRIQENLQQSSNQINLTNRNTHLTFVDHDYFYDQQPKKIYQYAAPKFIANGTMHKKKRNFELQKQKEKQPQTSDRRKNINFPTRATGEKKVIQFRTTINNFKPIGQNPENKNKSQPKQGKERMKMYYKSPQTRVKTGVIHTSLQSKELHGQNNSQSKSKQTPFDVNEYRKSKIKKQQMSPKPIPQYNMKNPGFTFVSMLANDIFSQQQTHSNKQLPRYESPRNLDSRFIQPTGFGSPMSFYNQKHFFKNQEK